MENRRLLIWILVGQCLLTSLVTHAQSCPPASDPCAPQQNGCPCILPCVTQQCAQTPNEISSSVSIPTDWISTLIWTFGVLGALIMFRRPIINLTERAEKINFKEWSIDLAKFSSASEQFDLNQMMAMDAQDSGQQTIKEMVAQLRETRHVEYLVVDLDDGTEWWASRLYLLTRLLSEMTETKWIVFVEKAQKRRVFVTALAPETVWKALEYKTTAFASAFDTAGTNAGAPIGTLARKLRSDENIVQNLINNFLFNLQDGQFVPTKDKDYPKRYRRTVNGMAEETPLVSADLVYGLGKFDRSVVKVKRHARKQAVSLAVLDVEGEIVAVTDDDGVFMYLVDRSKMLEQAWFSYRDVLEE